MSEIRFKKRKQIGLHCRFCYERNSNLLYETMPISGIVCIRCKEHLEDYFRKQAGEKK